MKHWIWMFCLAAAATSVTAEAGEYWNTCNSCSESQLRQAALRAVPEKAYGFHDAYVADFDREAVHKYGVWRYFDAELWVSGSSAWPVTTESHIGFEFTRIVSAMKADVASLESGKLIPEDVVGSAFDLVHNSVYQLRVADYIIDHMSLWESIGAPVFVPLSLLSKVVDLNLVVSVSFVDGSTARFVLTGVDGSLGDLKYVFELVDGSARDADGNVIPGSSVEAAPYEGTFSSEPAGQRMSDFIRYWYGSTAGRSITCASSHAGSHIIVTCARN